ncbi:hypothetical protein BHM03_00047900 [Ensete ventricosum]|nr:hypothetical protein BHM03_00047900 [Ensete ventricosum]
MTSSGASAGVARTLGPCEAIVTSAKDTDDIKGQEAEKEEQQGKKAQSVIAGGDLNAVCDFAIYAKVVILRILHKEAVRSSARELMGGVKEEMHRVDLG